MPSAPDVAIQSRVPELRAPLAARPASPPTTMQASCHMWAWKRCCVQPPPATTRLTHTMIRQQGSKLDPSKLGAFTPSTLGWLSWLRVGRARQVRGRSSAHARAQGFAQGSPVQAVTAHVDAVDLLHVDFVEHARRRQRQLGAGAPAAATLEGAHPLRAEAVVRLGPAVGPCQRHAPQVAIARSQYMHGLVRGIRAAGLWPRRAATLLGAPSVECPIQPHPCMWGAHPRAWTACRC